MLKQMKKALTKTAESDAEAVPADDPVIRLNEKLATAEKDVGIRRKAFHEATLDAELEEDTPRHEAALQRKQAAADALTTAQARVDELKGAIAAAESRKVEQKRREHEAETAQRWQATLPLLTKRAKAAADIEAAAKAFGDAAKRFTDSTAAIYTTCPAKLDLDSALLRANDLQVTMQLELVRNGLAWAGKWPWPPDQIPPITERVTKANGEVEVRHATGTDAP